MTFGAVIKRFFTNSPSAAKPLDLQSFEEARKRLHKAVKSSASDVSREVDAFADMVRSMHAERLSPSKSSKRPKKNGKA